MLNATHRPIHAYKIITKPEITEENDMLVVIRQIYSTLKETFDFFVYIGEPVEHKGKKLADRVIYSFNDIISKESIDVTVGWTTVQVLLSKLMKNYILTFDRNKQHYIAVYNNLLKTLISFSDYQILKTPYTYSNEGLFYLTSEVIIHPDDIWQVLKDTAKQYSTKEEKESREEELKQQAYKRLNSNIRKESDYSAGFDEKDEDDYDHFDDDDNEEYKSESNLIENFQILQGAANISVKKKHTFLIHIRDREDVFRGWEYQLKFLEKGLGVFLRPVVIRRNKVTVHEYWGDLYDWLLYHKNTPIKKIDEMLHGMVVVRVNDKDRAYQIIKINRDKCPELQDNAGLWEEYEDEYLEGIRVDLKEWLGRPVNLTDREERIILKDVSLKEIYQIYHKVFCRETNPEKLLTQNFKLLKTLNYFALKQLNIFDWYETFSTKPWRVMCKFLENPVIDISRKGLNKKRESRYLEIDRNIDTEIL